MKKLLLLSMLCGAVCAEAQLRNDDVYELPQYDNSSVRNEIIIPDVGPYKVLKCDFHIHTIFSDGSVWPDIRVQEAWQDGLDAIAITDHIEYRPKKDILKGDLNESYKIANKFAQNYGLIVVKGTEITRSKPLGHLNALFIEDAEKMKVEDPLKSIDEAVAQGAFIMWNHPGWPNDTCTMYPVHEKLIKEGKLNGVEVFNYQEYYPLSFDWPTRHNIAFMANSDIHGLINVEYNPSQGFRPMTLVLATDKTEKALRDGMNAARTIAFFNNTLVGSEQNLKSLLKSCVKVTQTGNTVEVANVSDIPFTATSGGNTYYFPAGKTVRIGIPKDNALFTVTNCYTGKNKNLTVSVSEFM